MLYKYVPCDVIKMRDERRSGKGSPLKRDGSIDVKGHFSRTLCKASFIACARVPVTIRHTLQRLKFV